VEYRRARVEPEREGLRGGAGTFEKGEGKAGLDGENTGTGIKENQKEKNCGRTIKQGRDRKVMTKG